MDPVAKKTFQGIPVTFENEEALNDAGFAVAGCNLSQMSVTLSANKSVINKIDEEDIVCTVDVKNLDLGENECRIKVVVPSKVKVVDQEFETARVKVEMVKYEKKEVQVSFTNIEDEGLEPTAISKSLSNAVVYGAASLVDRVSYVKAAIDTANVSKSQGIVRAKLVPVDEKGNRVKEVKTREDFINVTTILYSTKKVPLKVRIIGAGERQVEKPSQVTIKGPLDILDTIKEVKAEDVYVGLESKIAIKVKLPKDVYLSESDSKMVVKVEQVGEATKTFTISADQIKTSGDYRIETKAVEIVLKGKKSVMEVITEKDIKLSCDEEGQLKCHVGQEVEIVEISPSKVQITLED
ncbi:MAG: CdaR family protein [Clostridia bacterium]|nr:CdaR family protein [Clostridia bacterium]